MVAVGDGVRLGTVECQEQFRHRRWNCSAIGSGSVFGHVVVVGKYSIQLSLSLGLRLMELRNSTS
jgi:hypothetical protein